MILSHQKFDLWGKCLVEKVRIQAPFRFSVNFPNEACFIYYEEGTSKVNSALEQIPINSKESILLQCGTYFSNLLEYTEGNQYEILVVHLHPDTLRKIYQYQFPVFIKQKTNKPFIHKVASLEVIKKFVESLYFYFENPTLVNDEILELKIRELILLLVQSKNANSLLDLLLDLFTPRQLSIKEVVNQHLFSDISIEDLAELANLSVSTFKRDFYELYKTTPANYIKMKRLERAKELLKMSNLTISEVSFQTCFHDVAHFSRAFKVMFGFTPSAFRQSNL
jgi:AraC-like DNA-binding protein